MIMSRVLLERKIVMEPKKFFNDMKVGSGDKR